MKNQSDCPKGFVEDVFETSFSMSKKRCLKMWQKLQLRETFVKSQLFPYKVEFDSESQKGAFLEGELNTHHGPGISLHGAIGKVDESYRDLKYFYGSYVLTFRLIRVKRLEFFKDSDEQIRIRLTTYTRSWFKFIWNRSNYVFWKMFNLTFIC